MKTDNWYMKNEKEELVEATSENIVGWLDSLNKPQKPISEQEERDTEKRYLEQLNVHVKCYYDGKYNVVKFL